MVCDKTILNANLQTTFFSGVLIGSFVFGVLADK